MVEIRGSSPSLLPPSAGGVTPEQAPGGATAAAATAATKAAAKVGPGDEIVRGGAKPTGPAATLAPAAPPAVDLDPETLAGAASFATQLHSLALSNDSNDLTAAFLKLGVHGDKYDREFENASQQAQSILRQLAIATARALGTTAVTSTEQLASLTTALENLDRSSRDMVKDGNWKEEEKLRKALQGQMDGKEDKSVSQEKREGQLKKPGPKGAAPTTGATSGSGGDATAGLVSAVGGSSERSDGAGMGAGDGAGGGATNVPGAPGAAARPHGANLAGPSGKRPGAEAKTESTTKPPAEPVTDPTSRADAAREASAKARAGKAPAASEGAATPGSSAAFVLSPTADRALVQPALDAIAAGVGPALPKDPLVALELARLSVAQAVEAFGDRADEVAKSKLR